MWHARYCRPVKKLNMLVPLSPQSLSALPASLAGSLVLFVVAAQPASAAGLRLGAYADALGISPVVCVTSQHLANLTLPAWQQSMQQAGLDCTVSESGRPMPGYETWTASCVGQGQGASAAQAYKFSVLAEGERLIVDSAVKNAAGELVSKKAFGGAYRGACAPDTPPFDVQAYLGRGESPRQVEARKALAADLIRCGNVFNGLSVSVAKSRQEGMRAAATAMLEAAVSLHPGDGSFHMEAVKKSAPEVAAELVGASAEKKFAVYQSCSPYLEPDGIAQALKNRVATGTGAR